ncbi:hypothetical protein [Archangium sp.]|nr:hypothetical protein [Archangium sp.]HYO55712.1 hypothetical protein [Archangium sp.]
MAIHPAGSRVLVGQFQGTADFGSGPVTSRSGSTGVPYDIFVLKSAP